MFNATATTEIYTYGHTLSLHVALPILFGARVAPGSGHEFRRIDDPQIRCPQFAFQPFGRSEEHTSELQSLMRISYAVFCLKKKTIFYVIYRYIVLLTHLITNTKHLILNIIYCFIS